MEAGKFDSIVDAMIYGIDNAYVVLVCFSERYKNSQNCRTGKCYTCIKSFIIHIKHFKGNRNSFILVILINTSFYITSFYMLTQKRKCTLEK